MTEEYKAAYDAHNEATTKFYAVRDAYRARLIGDAEFLAAKAEYAEATKLFDAAYAIASA